MKSFVTTSRALFDLPRLSALVGETVEHRWPLQRAEGAAGVLAWGRKSSAEIAEKYAAENHLRLYRLEDGFLRSLGLGSSEPPLSIVIDDVGIYYDAGGASRLEQLVEKPLSPAQAARAGHIVALWRENRVSKYNHLREPRSSRIPDRRYVLVADQTFGDASIRFGMAGPESFARMLDAALEENPECTVLLKIHPDVMSGKKRGHFDLAALARFPRVVVLADDVHPVGLIERAEAVYVVTSQMGFEGLLWGKRVRTFGMPFYAGWGLTEDELPTPGRRKPVPLENLVHAALGEYPRYIDPETGERCEVERLIQWMGLQRRMRGRFPEVTYGLNFSPWKKTMVRAFFQGSSLRFVRRVACVPAGAALVVWGRKPVHGELPESVQPVYLEDGFLRSVGLGADLVTPLSWVMDRRGIYYDATRSSDLEHLLQTHAFDDAIRERAGRLREAIVRHGLTKYNVGAGKWVRPEARENTVVGAQSSGRLPLGEQKESPTEWAPTGELESGGMGCQGGAERQGTLSPPGKWVRPEARENTVVGAQSSGRLPSGEQKESPTEWAPTGELESGGMGCQGGAERQGVLSPHPIPRQSLHALPYLLHPCSRLPKGEGSRRVILVPGQVETDASIRYGAAEVRTNLGLLRAVREANPDAYVVYKPHPDVLAGLRKAGNGEDEAAWWCDEIVEDVPMQVMLDAVDEVHVITSLAGFEALLRGRKVTCYGNPFYAGWGLTHDMAPLARRTRRLSLDELVAGVLILYPTYISRTTGRFTTPERALEELLAWREQGASGMPLWRKGLRVILRALKLNG